MWGTKARLVAELEARVLQLMGQRDAAREDAERHLRTTVRASRSFVCAEDEAAQLRGRLHCMLRITRKQRAEMRRQELTIRRLQQRLDDATGLNHPAVQAGAKWQARRQDKPIGGAK